MLRLYFCSVYFILIQLPREKYFVEQVINISKLLPPLFSILQHPPLGRITTLKCFMRLENTLGGTLDPSSIQNLSRSLISFVCACGLPCSIQTTGFQWSSSPKTEMAIENVDFCAQLTISLWMLMCLAGRSTYGQVSAS